MRKHQNIKVSEVKRGDVLIKSDNSKWTVIEANLMPKHLVFYYILARNGSKLERWEYLKSTTSVRKSL